MPKTKFLLGAVGLLSAVAGILHFKGDDIVDKVALEYATVTEVVDATELEGAAADLHYVTSVRAESRDSAVRVVSSSGQGSKGKTPRPRRGARHHSSIRDHCGHRPRGLGRAKDECRKSTTGHSGAGRELET